MKIKIKLFHFIVLLCWAFIAPSNAAIVEDLYTIKLPVVDQTTRVRLDSFKQAFVDVLVKVSGSKALLNDPLFESSFSKSTHYVKQFHYEQKQRTQNAVKESTIILSVEFDEKLVVALLRSKGYPIWGRVRPSVLIVMSKKQNRKYKLVSEDTFPDLIQYIDDLSHKHGLPTQFPLFDLEDRAILNHKESALDNLTAIINLGNRYQSDVVLVGELIGVSGKGWKSIWQSQFSGRLFQWEDKAKTKKEVMSKAMAHLSKILAQEYALGSIKDSANIVEVSVANVKSLKSYLFIARYLSSLAVVEKTQLKRLNNEHVLFTLLLRNSPEELQRLIELGDVIEQVDLPVIDVTVERSDEAVSQNLLNLTYRLLE